MMAAKRKTTPPSLEIGLHAPGMTPMLRCGLGGLAAALHCIWGESRAEEDDDAPPPSWPAPVRLGPGTAVVETKRVVIDWGGDPRATLAALFEAAFRIEKGVITLAGTFPARSKPTQPVLWQRQNALKRTFLQHGKTTTKEGGPKLVELQIDDQSVQLSVQPYVGFAHQSAVDDVLAALEKGAVQLAGWAQPGAAQRHVKFAQTKWEYGPGDALAALFALSGAVSLEIVGSNAGALVLLEPDDLVRFSTRRPLLLRNEQPTLANSLGDAVLSINLACFLGDKVDGHPGVRATQGVILKTTPWNSKQKVRTAVLEPAFAREDLATYAKLRAVLRPRRVEIKKPKEGQPSSFLARSELLAFLTDNIAAGRPWHRDFATARTDEKKPRFIHYYASGPNLGALRFHEKKGLITMVDEHLEPSQQALVRSVQQALKMRFAQIYDETKSLAPQGRNKRFEKEQERWRMALAGAKTQAQLRGILADLWSRAGRNKVLQGHWEQVVPLLAPAHWQEARDLALIALASYEGKGTNNEPSDTDSTDDPEPEQD